MNIDALLASVRAYTSVTNTTVLPDSIITEAINQAIRRLQRVHPFRGSINSVELTVPAATSVVNLPSDYVSEYGVWLKDTSGGLSEIQKTLRRFWITEAAPPTTLRDSVFPQVAVPSTSTRLTLGYYVFDGALYLVPSITGDVVVQLDYASLVPDLVSGTAQTNHYTDRYPDVVRLGALADVYFYLHEWDAATSCLNAFAAAARESMHSDVSDAMSGPPHQRGK